MSRPGTWRRRHRHLFAWLIVGGGAVLSMLVVLGVLHALGVGGLISDAYFAAAAWVLPAGYLAGFQALPAAVHVLIAMVAIVVVAGLVGEVLD